MLAGRKNVSNPDAPINLVHRQHVIDIVKKLITEELKTSIVHAISEPHESRKNYYSQKAKEFGLEPPQFDENGKSVGKKIESLYH